MFAGGSSGERKGKISGVPLELASESDEPDIDLDEDVSEITGLQVLKKESC